MCDVCLQVFTVFCCDVCLVAQQHSSLCFFSAYVYSESLTICCFTCYHGSPAKYGTIPNTLCFCIELRVLHGCMFFAHTHKNV